MKRFFSILIFMLIFFILAQVSIAQPLVFQKRDSFQPNRVLSSPNGRYVFGQISDSEKDQYMLDTWTGRLWRMSENGEVGKFLLPIPYQISEGKYSYLPPQVKKKKKKEKSSNNTR